MSKLKVSTFLTLDGVQPPGDTGEFERGGRRPDVRRRPLTRVGPPAST